jgi:hypothetical protein
MEREMMMSTSGVPPEDVDIKYKNNTSASHPIATGSAQGVVVAPPSGPSDSTAAPISSPITTGAKVATPSNPTNAPTVSNVVETPNTSLVTASTAISTPPESHQPPPPPTPIMTNASIAFVNQHCDLNPLKSWYPESSDDAWQRRAPYVILTGVWNAGIEDVAKDLSSSKVFTHSKNDGFFLPKQFYRVQIGQKTKVYGARQRMYAQMYNTKALKEDTNLRYIDVSPGYLFYPKTIYPILCVAPWTKFIVVLRNPVERLYRQWVYGKVHLQLTLSLEDWMAREMKVMQSVGLLSSSSSSNANDNNDSEQDLERQAWNRYQSARTMISGAIGRSLYVLQLQEWFDTLRLAGKDPKDIVYVVPSEALLGEDSVAEYAKLFSFLETSPSEPVVTRAAAASNNNNNNVPPMKEETKQMLREFFAPYNERLANLLGDDFGSYDWKNIWKEY